MSLPKPPPADNPPGDDAELGELVELEEDDCPVTKRAVPPPRKKRAKVPPPSPRPPPRKR